MIARQLIPIITLIVLADAYIWWRFVRRRSVVAQLCWWLPAVGMLGYTAYLASIRDFVPEDLGVLNVYLFLFGLLVVPKLLFSLCSIAGRCWCRLRGTRRNYGNMVGLVAVLLSWYVLFYGTFVGFHRLEIRQVEYASSDLPAAFDGYRIVQFSDAHVGTLTGKRLAILQRAVDSINALKPDMIVFTGDLQNAHPRELYPCRDILSSLQAKDGVFSVLGNHDYAEYVGGDPVEKESNCSETQSLERQMGWTLLTNQHRLVCRGNEHIVVAGMENDGEGRFPQLGDIAMTLQGVSPQDFVVMLEHDPTAWRRKILPQCHAQLTLSGHTHAMQFSLFGWSPVAWIYKEWGGMYYEGARAINVSVGLGGVIPFRFGATGELVVITLRRAT